MPTYSYRCSACANEFEQFQRITEDPLTVCPECGGLVKRIIQPVGVVFKGSGWYITDSRKSNGSDPDSSSVEKPAKDGETKTKTDKSDKKEKATSTTT